MTETRPEIALSIKTSDFMTNFHDVGAGDAVLLLHGSGPGVTAWANWNRVFDRLAGDFRLIAPDMAGFGYSERLPGAEYNMDLWLQQVIDLLDGLCIERTHLIGNSFGGALALALAIEHPERVDRLVLMGSMGVSFAITRGLESVWGYQPSLANMAKLLETFTYDHSFATPGLIKSRYEGSIQPGFQETFSSMFPEPRQQSVDRLAARESRIPQIKQETLIIHGLQDRVIPVMNSYRLVELIPNAQLHVFGKCGHWTQIERTAEFCDLVRDFLSRRQRTSH